MLVNGKDYKYSKVIDCFYDGVCFNKVERKENDLFLYAHFLMCPGHISDLSNKKKLKVDKVINDCLIVIKNYKVKDEYFEPNLKNIKNKLFYLLNSKRKLELKNKGGKIKYSLFDYYFFDTDGEVSIDVMEYEAVKKIISFKNGTTWRCDDKYINGTDHVVLVCDEITCYWNEYSSSTEQQYIKLSSYKANKEKNNMELNEQIKKDYLKLIRAITNFDNDITNKFRECLNGPQEYFKRNYSNYKERGLTEYTNDEEICFLALLDLLVENEYCCELDWKIDMSSFMVELQSLKNSLSFDEDNLDNEYDLSIWCHFINEKWKNKNICIADIFTNSDSYAIFICDTEKMGYLSTLGEKLNCPISKMYYTDEKLKRAGIDLEKINNKKISKYLGKNDFGGKTRDKIKDEEYWNEFIESQKTAISWSETFRIDIENSSSDTKERRLEWVKSDFRYNAYLMILGMYSAGYDIDVCRQEYQVFLKYAIDDVLIDTIGWQRITEYIALGVLLDVDGKMIDYLKQIIKLSGCNNELITFFMSYLDNSYSCEIPETKLSKCYCYKKLEDIVYGKSNKTESINIIANYLEKEWTKTSEEWEERSHNGHYYYGYWAFEIGAIVKILKIEDESFKKFRYYPYDLVHYNYNAKKSIEE